MPHAYGTVACNVDNLMNLKRQFTNSGTKVSVNDIIIKCAANALLRCPQVNVVWEGQNVSCSYSVVHHHQNHTNNIFCIIDCACSIINNDTLFVMTAEASSKC